MPATFCLGLDRAILQSESVEAISVASLIMLGTGSCIRLLLRGATRAGEGGISIVSTADDNGRLPDDIVSEIRYGRLGAGLFFLLAFDIFDEWIGPRDTLATS
jgi:hypothetical protein